MTVAEVRSPWRRHRSRKTSGRIEPAASGPGRERAAVERNCHRHPHRTACCPVGQKLGAPADASTPSTTPSSNKSGSRRGSQRLERLPLGQVLDSLEEFVGSVDSRRHTHQGESQRWRQRPCMPRTSWENRSMKPTGGPTQKPSKQGSGRRSRRWRAENGRATTR